MNSIHGLAHIGIPTEKLEETLHFYEQLGFIQVYKTQNGSQHVVFMVQGGLQLEIYEQESSCCDGAIDHIALNCSDIDCAYAEIQKLGLQPLNPGIQTLPFWDRGIRYFLVQGPNRERIEFCQRL